MKSNDKSVEDIQLFEHLKQATYSTATKRNYRKSSFQTAQRQSFIKQFVKSFWVVVILKKHRRKS